MSLVLEALRRVEKPDARPGSVGVAVASYRPARRRRSPLLPLILGLSTGVVLLLSWRPQGRTAEPSPAAALESPPRAVAAEPSEATRLTTSDVPRVSPSEKPPGRAVPSTAPMTALPKTSALVTRPPLVLQAISERDSRPIAVINDRLVKEGDLFEGARVLKIDAESVEVLLETGQKATVRFATPPVTVSPTPELR
ncbi:MAG: hypothetical protein JJE39_08680 [Vicinamibacteria bacterium]|nr:hypothetical protein [Vicinamibacteria bacterium]